MQRIPLPEKNPIGGAPSAIYAREQLPLYTPAVQDALAPYSVTFRPNQTDEVARFVWAVDRLLNDPRASTFAKTAVVAVLASYGIFKTAETVYSGGALSFEPGSAALAMSLVVLIAQQSGIDLPESAQLNKNVVLKSFSADDFEMHGIALINGTAVEFSSDGDGVKAETKNSSCEIGSQEAPVCKIERK